jgi:SAM-dependent methyltransferase
MSTSPDIDQAWYNRFYGEEPDSELVVPPEIVRRYRVLRHPDLFHLERLHQLVGDVRGKKCLYIGCGLEGSTILLALKGAEIWALDVAVEALRRQRTMGRTNGTDTRSHYAACACEHLPFRNESFDLVIGIGIWHHLQDDLDTPCSEVARVLKKDGHAVFSEPIARSRLLQRVRECLPIPRLRDASPQCRPLLASGLSCFARHFRVKADFFGFLGRLDRLLLGGQPLEFAPRWKQWATYFFHYVDHLLFHIPRADRLAGVVVLNLRGHVRRSRRGARGVTAGRLASRTSIRPRHERRRESGYPGSRGFREPSALVHRRR